MTQRITVDAITEGGAEWFAALSGPDPAGLADQLRAMWREGTSRPEWCLAARRDGLAVGRLALAAEPMGGGVDELEFRAVAPWVDLADDERIGVARALFDAGVEIASTLAPTMIERRLNPELHADVDEWRAILEACGFTLFQEKEGFVWTDEGQALPEPRRLHFSSLAEIGGDAYAASMAASIPGTLDRNDRYYLERCGASAWGREMVGFLEEADAGSWLVAREPDGTLAGYVAVGGFEKPATGTIAHIAVVPERRGRGYVDELLGAANIAARRRGYRFMLSDVDTVNAPMLAAMERNGHRAGVRPWHVWAYRRPIGSSV